MTSDNLSTEFFEGTVIFFGSKNKANMNNSYGFISVPNKADLFIHFSDLLVDGYKTLNKGDRVRFQYGVNNKGLPKAINVEVIEKAKV